MKRSKWLTGTVAAWMFDAHEIDVIRRAINAAGLELELGDEQRAALVRVRRRLSAKGRLHGGGRRVPRAP